MNLNKKIFLNGHEFYITKDLTLNQILNYLNYKDTLFVIEYNSMICDRNEWIKINLNHNDKIEIITIVGGG